MLVDVLIIVICIVVIAQGAIWLVDSAVKIASRLGISELVIGLTIVSIGTSAPEFGVTILAALRGMGDISVGNIVGSNIFNLGFILGGTAVAHNLRTNRSVVYRDGIFLLFGALLLTIFLWDLSLVHIEGIILLLLLIGYLGFLYSIKSDLLAPTKAVPMRFQDPLLLLLGIIMVLAGSHFLVESAVDLAKVIGVSEWVIGATIIAAGTSAPEFATSLVAALRGHPGISVGNLIGSDIFNIFGVLGLTAIMRNLTVDVGSHSSLILLSMMIMIVLVFMRTGWQISRKEGLVLVCIGIARWIYMWY